MKKFWMMTLAAATAAAALPAYALRSGDPVQELNVKWVQGTPLALLPPAKPQPNEPRLKAAVFFLTRAANRDETLTMLNNLRRSYAGPLRLAAVTPDSEADVREMLKARPDFTLPLGVDQKRQLTANYMNGSMLYPMAFVTDDSGRIIWSGELVDLGEMVQNYLEGNFDASRQKKLAPLLDELQTLLRENNDRRMKMVTNSILKIDPGNAAALRIRLFVLENSGRLDEAWQLIDSQLRQQPKLERLYFAALDLAMRHPELAGRIPALLAAYRSAIAGNPDSDNLMAWTLLNRLPDDPAALRSAVELAGRAESQLKPDSAPALRAAILSTRSLIAYRLGNVAGAVKFEQEAAAFWKKADLPGNAANSRLRLDYYRTVQELAGKQ